MPTSNVTVTRSGATFNIDVTACNLLTDLTIKDFQIFYDGVFFCEGTTCTNYTKTSVTNIQYSGSSIPSTVIQVRRKTPNNVVQFINYANRFSSSLWNQELDRIIRWREEADLNGVGFSSITTVATPINDPFSSAWDGNVINPVTANALYDHLITLAPLASPTFTGDPKAPTPATADNDNSIATTAYVKNNLASYAPLSSPAFTGNPTGTTQSANTNNTTLATTAFVHQELRNALEGTSTVDQIRTGVFKNAVINGRFNIWQRNTSFTFTTDGANGYTADRWFYEQSRGGSGTVGSITVSRQTHILGQSPLETNSHPKFFLRLDVTTAPSGTGAAAFHRIRTHIENVLLFSGQQCTLSFLARSSIASKVLGYRVVQSFGSGGSPSSSVEVTSGTIVIDSTTVFTRYTVTFSMPSVSGKTLGTNPFSDSIVVFFYIQSGSSEIPPNVPLSTTGSIDISSVQLERGAYATSYEAIPFSQELKLCCRYYQKSYAYETVPGTATTNGATTITVPTAGTGAMRCSTTFPVEMRITPTITLYDGAGASGMVFKGGNGKTGAVVESSASSFNAGTSDATSAVQLAYQWTAEADY